jgi:hypothetical protein
METSDTPAYEASSLGLEVCLEPVKEKVGRIMRYDVAVSENPTSLIGP